MSVFRDIQGFLNKAGQGGASCFDVSIDVLVLGQAGLICQRVVGEHRVIAGGAGATSVGEAGGILFCRGAQIQVLLLKERKKQHEIHRVIARRTKARRGLGSKATAHKKDSAKEGTFQMVKAY